MRRSGQRDAAAVLERLGYVFLDEDLGAGGNGAAGGEARSAIPPGLAGGAASGSGAAGRDSQLAAPTADDEDPEGDR